MLKRTVAPCCDVQIDVALEMDRPLHEPIARRHDDAAAAGLVAGGDRLVERRPAIGLAVADRAKFGDGEVALGKRGRLDLGEDRGDGIPTGDFGGVTIKGEQTNEVQPSPPRARPTKKFAWQISPAQVIRFASYKKRGSQSDNWLPRSIVQSRCCANRSAHPTAQSRQATQAQHDHQDGARLGDGARCKCTGTCAGVAEAVLPESVVAGSDSGRGIAVAVEAGIRGCTEIVSPDGVVGGVDGTAEVEVTGKASRFRAKSDQYDVTTTCGVDLSRRRYWLDSTT